jgi:hypothetical protein
MKNLKLGEHTAKLLERLALPPTPRDMRHVVTAMIEDDDIGGAREHTAAMLDHWTGQNGPESVGEFYYWLGVTQVLRAIVDGRWERTKQRLDRKWQRKYAGLVAK